MFKFGKKRVLALAAVAALAVAGIAYAYWTTTGSGTGTGSVKASNGTVVLTGTITSPLAPGTSSSVTFTAANAGASHLYVGTVHLDSVTTDQPDCVVSDFSMSDVVENHIVPTGATAEPLPANGTVSFANTAANQDACKSAAVTLHLSSN